MFFSKRSIVIAYLNLLLCVAVATLSLGVHIRRGGTTDLIKRQLYTDLLGITCVRSEQCNYGDCIPLNKLVSQGPHICNCYPGYTSFESICDLQLIPQLNAFMASFFGGWVGADWFYLYRNGSSGGYVVAGIFKLLTIGGLSIWWVVDWCRILTNTFYDGYGYPLWENITG
eukprot:TRINITY_DN12256_c0_g1_i2.p1 TRINITY_DN12256_c0_g1~~TRINITY_DN12256_c0_g1_i2.p1  ORF type:complete len:171 (-),score=16.14 TRINITY_DN12256_c0_g1_i2:60-572(-)